MSVYVVDSNIFIQANQSHYPLDVVVSYWKLLSRLASQGKIISIKKVKNEVCQEPELKKWCEKYLSPEFWQDSLYSYLSAYAETVSWITENQGEYRDDAVGDFLEEDNADAFLISYCLGSNMKLVTLEESKPYSKKVIKIPDVCMPMGVDCIKPIAMLRELGETF